MKERIRKIWHYFKCVIIKREELSRRQIKKFKYFGKDTTINTPAKLISGMDKISIGDGTTILKNSRLQCYTQERVPNSSIVVGNKCYIGFNFTALSGPGGSIKIGNEVLIASDVIVTNENHGIDPESEIPYMDQPLKVKSVKIDDGCWIGEKVCIMQGVSVGEKSIIGAASVVTKDIPAYSIAAGSPARVIKQYDFYLHQWVKV